MHIMIAPEFKNIIEIYEKLIITHEKIIISGLATPKNVISLYNLH